MRMRDVLWQIWLNCGYFLTVAASGFFLYKLCAPFVRPRNGRFWRVLLFLTLAGSTGMVIWIGDPNLLYTLPAFFALFLLSTRGDRIGRVAVCIILFCRASRSAACNPQAVRGHFGNPALASR